MSLVQDLHFALRSLRRNPGISAVAILSLALGIGAVSSVWSIVNTLILQPLPYDPEGELVFVGTNVEGRGSASSPSSVPDFLDLRQGLRTLALAAYRDEGVNVGRDPAEWATVRLVSDDYFPVLGVEPVLGRGFTPAEAREGAPVVILSHAWWERRFGADPGVLGQTLLVDGEPVTVVGVLAAEADFGRGHPELHRPLALGEAQDRGARPLSLVGRLDGTDLTTARRELEGMGRALAEVHPATNALRSFSANYVQDQWFGGPIIQQGMLSSMAAAVMVLLIACANVANLLLAKGSEREGEIALRQALGAGGWRIVRQLLTEAMALAAVAGVLGLGLAHLGVRAMRTLIPPQWPGDISRDPGAGTLLFVAGSALGAALLFGMAPALRAARGALHRGLAGGRGSLQRRGGQRLRWLLVGGETTLAVVLLTTTVLVVRSGMAIQSADTGFDTQGVVVAQLQLPTTGYPAPEDLREAAAALEQALQATVAGASAGLSVGTPGRSWRGASYRVEGQEADESRSAIVRFLTPGYMDALGMAPRRGRSLALSDADGAPDVALVNERFAERNWPGSDPLGRTIRVGERTVEVVGVLPDVRELGPAVPAQDVLYLPLAQWPQRALSLVVRDPRGPAEGLAAIREAVDRVDPGLALHGTETLREGLLSGAEQYRALSQLLGVLAAVALALALVGVYAAVAYSVSRRVPEIGVRMALGADRRSVLLMILRGAVLVSGSGLLVGLVLSAVAARGMSAFMFGLGARDPVPFVVVASALLLVSVAAAWLPARRASSVDPLQALRAD